MSTVTRPEASALARASLEWELSAAGSRNTRASTRSGEPMTYSTPHQPPQQPREAPPRHNDLLGTDPLAQGINIGSPLLVTKLTAPFALAGAARVEHNNPVLIGESAETGTRLGSGTKAGSTVVRDDDRGPLGAKHLHGESVTVDLDALGGGRSSGEFRRDILVFGHRCSFQREIVQLARSRGKLVSGLAPSSVTSMLSEMR